MSASLRFRRYRYVQSILIVSGMFLLPLSSEGAAETFCDKALTTNALNTTDYAASSRLLIRKRDEACQSEYNSFQEAVNSGRSAGGSLGYGAFSFGANEVTSLANNKFSIKDSRLCRASLEELDSINNVNVKTQVADLAVSAWLACVQSTQTNKLFLRYALSNDGSGLTGEIVRTVGLNGGGFGTITGIATQGNAASLRCKVGVKNIESNKPIEIRIDKAPIGFSCEKKATEKVAISINTDQGDQAYIDIPSAKEQEQNELAKTNAAVEAVRGLLLASLKEVSQRQENEKRSNELQFKALKDQTEAIGVTAATERTALRYTFVPTGQQCPAGWTKAGQIGWIMLNSDLAGSLGTGGTYNEGYTWIHPDLCKRQ